jgi:hypothetical protein
MKKIPVFAGEQVQTNQLIITLEQHCKFREQVREFAESELREAAMAIFYVSKNARHPGIR